MRLSLEKAAHATLNGDGYRKSGISLVFARCEMPQILTSNFEGHEAVHGPHWLTDLTLQPRIRGELFGASRALLGYWSTAEGVAAGE
jgi:hypothetical protein